MFNYPTKIRLRNTDASGVLYFADQFTLALEAFEAFISLNQELLSGEFLLPVVHAEADYKAPLHVGDEITIKLKVVDMGNTSFRVFYQIYNKHEREMGTVAIVHVVVSKRTQQSMPIPSVLKNLLGRGG